MDEITSYYRLFSSNAVVEIDRWVCVNCFKAHDILTGKVVEIWDPSPYMFLNEMEVLAWVSRGVDEGR